MEWHELDRDDGVMGYETGKIMLCFFSTVDKGLVFAWLTATLIFFGGNFTTLACGGGTRAD